MNFVQLCREIKRKNDQIRERLCTCHPDDISPPCEHKYALTDCRMARLERQRDELAAALRELYLIADTIRRAHWTHWQSEETYKLTASINRARAICDAIGARLGEGGEG